MTFTSRLRPLVLALAFTLPIAGCTSKSAEAYLAEGKQLEAKGDNKSAVIQLKSAVQMQPTNGEARLWLGKALFKLNDYPHAEKELIKARELGGAAEEILPLLAKLYLATNEHQKVIDQINPAPTLAPKTLAALQAARARALIFLERPDEARQILAEAEKSAPGNADVIIVKAMLAAIDKSEDQAIQLLDSVIKQEPTKIEAYYFKASLLLQAGKRDEAKALFDQVLKIDPTQIVAHSSVATMLLSSGEVKSADSALKSAESVLSGNLMLTYLRAWVDYSQGRYKESRDAISKVLAKVPDNPNSQLLYSALSYELGDYEQARKSGERAYASLPNNLFAGRLAASSLVKLGDGKAALGLTLPLLEKHASDLSLNLLAADAYAQTKDFNKSQIYLEKARALAPDNDSIKVRLANVMLANGNSAKAIDLLEQASKSQKTVIESDKTLVMMLIEDKQFDRALQTLSDLERKSPKSASIQGLRALAFKGKNDIPAARKALEQALAIDPAYFPAVKQLVEFDREAKNYTAAKKRLNDLLKKDVKNADAMFELAGIAYLEKQEPAYLSWLEKVVSTQPSYLQAYALLVNFHLAKQAPQKALTIARSAASGNPENPNALRLLGSTQSALKDSPGAVSTFTRMTEKDPTSPTAFNSLAKAQADSGDFKAAKASLQKALQLQPDFLDALITLFHVELQNGNAETALKVASEIQRIHPAKVTGYHHAGDALIMLGRNELAIKAYEQAMAKGGGSVILAKLHKALVMQGKEPLAQQKAGAWLAKHPDDLLIRGTLADSHLANQRYAQAVAEYQQLIKLTAPDPSHLFLNNLAYAYQQAKDPRALATAEQAYKLAPKQSFVLDTYGSILLEAGRAKDALPHLRAALDLAPGSTSTRYAYALALSQTGKKTEAKRELQTLLESGKDFPERARANELISRL